MRRQRNVRRLANFVVIVGAMGALTTSIAGAAAKSNSTKPETTSLTIPLNASSAAVGYLAFAAQAGYYDKYGLSVSSPASDATQVKAAVVGGTVPLSGIGAVDTLNLITSGVKLKVIGCQALSVPLQMWAKSDIKSGKDLKSKTIGVSSLTSTVGITTLRYLDANNVKASEVTIVALGSVPNVLAALTSGRIDAGLLSYPFYQSAAASNGLHKIGDGPLAPNIYVVRSDWASTNHNTILAFLKGNTEGLAAYATDREAALPVLAKFLRLNLDDPTQGATVKEGYQLYHASFTPIHECEKTAFDAFVPYLTPEEQAALAKPGKFLDNLYIQELVKAGFYTKITKKYGEIPGMPQ